MALHFFELLQPLIRYRKDSGAPLRSASSSVSAINLAALGLPLKIITVPLEFNMWIKWLKLGKTDFLGMLLHF